MELSAAGDRIFAAEAILKRRVRKVSFRVRANVREHSTWEPEENILDDRLIQGFQRTSGWHPQLTPSCKDVVVTDVTTNLVTVTIKEFPSPSEITVKNKGFVDIEYLWA
uniref:Chromo domain-containing protein n=1 Tax=Neogobius melanostomus TaxID=47308 RepID=A0A8C6T8P3_9GOBI